MKFITSVISICILVPILFLIVFTPEKCEHEEIVETYMLTNDDKLVYSYIRQTCKNCESKVTQDHLFKGELIDKSYLAALQEHSDGREIIHGEYYTVTATVPTGFVAYGSTDVWLNCKVENEKYRIHFTVYFREEFRELVESIENGDEITFRGRYYDEGGYGFTDAELIIE